MCAFFDIFFNTLTYISTGSTAGNAAHFTWVNASLPELTSLFCFYLQCSSLSVQQVILISFAASPVGISLSLDRTLGLKETFSYLLCSVSALPFAVIMA